MTWKTKPTDRFLLKFIKLYLSAPISSRLAHYCPRIQPAMITFTAAGLGICGGFAFGFGYALQGAVLAAFAQVLDGVDGQTARLTGRVSAKGALLDSVLDRYMDFALLFGIVFHCLRFSTGVGGGERILSPGFLILIAALAAAGSSQVSYSTARAASLNIDFRRPESAGKGTRTAIIILCGLLTPFWIHFPLLTLLYLAVHTNLAVLASTVRINIK